jgi:transposase-like protein
MDDFKGRHFTGEVILWAVRWYCRYGISYRDLEEMLAERGIDVDHDHLSLGAALCAGDGEAVALVLAAGFDPSWRLDETYVKVRGKWTYLYRAVDKRGDTIDFFLSSTRSAKAAKRFWERPFAG